MVVAIVDGWPHGFGSLPCRRSARLRCTVLQAPGGTLMPSHAGFFPSVAPAVFLIFLSFSHRYRPHMVSYFGISLAQVVPRAVVYWFPFYPHAALQRLRLGALGWLSYHPCDRESNLSPFSFIPSTDLTSVLTVRMLICLVGI